MGTYTTNYQLFMPTVGEQGWGELINNNFSTIDTTMAGLNTRMGTTESNITSLTNRMGTAETTITSNTSRIGTLETEADAVDARVTKLEAGEFDSANIGSLTVGNGVFDDSISTNVIKMPYVTSGYLFAISKQTSNSKTSSTYNWGNASFTQECTVSELFAYITDRFRPITDPQLPVTVSIGVNNADHSATIKINGTTVKTFNVTNGTGSSYTSGNLKLTDTITVDTTHRSRTAGTSSLTVTISVPVFGI